MKLTIFAVIFLTFITGTTVSKARTIDRDYPGEWNSEFNISISKLLAKKNVKVCGEVSYKKHKTSNADFLLRCSNDGKKYYYFLAWPRTGELIGPYDKPEYR